MSIYKSIISSVLRFIDVQYSVRTGRCSSHNNLNNLERVYLEYQFYSINNYRTILMKIIPFFLQMIIFIEISIIFQTFWWYFIFKWRWWEIRRIMGAQTGCWSWNAFSLFKFPLKLGFSFQKIFCWESLVFCTLCSICK